MNERRYATRIPLRYLKEFKLEPLIIDPDDIFPYGIYIRDWLMERMPRQIKRMENLGLSPMVMPTKKALQADLGGVSLPMDILHELDDDPMLVFPGDVFPIGIPVPFVWFEQAGRPELYEQLREKGWAAAFVPR